MADIQAEVMRLVDGGEPEKNASQSAETDKAGGPFQLEPGLVARMISEPPSARRWLLKDLLPLGVVGLFAAAGGSGKSYAMLQLGVSVATGIPFVGLDIGETGGVLIIAAEDEADEIHRRLFRVIGHAKREVLTCE